MFATVGLCDAQLFMALAIKTELRVGDFSAQGLANLAWAFATASLPDVQLFTALAKDGRAALG